MHSCRSFGIPAALEISRSGQGAHVWIFFTARVPAAAARRLGSVLISHTCATTRQLRLQSYDRLFPNQDTLPKGGFGNLIALPLQKGPRERDATVFVNDAFVTYPDQWRFLSELGRVPAEEVDKYCVSRLAKDGNVLDVAFAGDDTDEEPWKRHRSRRAGTATASGVAVDHSGRSALHRERGSSAAFAQPIGAPGCVPEPGVLSCPGYAVSRLGQTACDRVRRESHSVRGVATWLP